MWIRRTGCLFAPRAREKKSCGSHGDEIRFLLSIHSTTSHRRRAQMHAMLRPQYLPAFSQGTPRPLIFCSQEAVDIHPPITPSLRQYSMQGQDQTHNVLQRLGLLEEWDLVRFKRELWTLGASEREKRGRCFSGMVISRQLKNYGEEDKAGDEWDKAGKIDFYTYSIVLLYRGHGWLRFIVSYSIANS